MEVFRPPEIQRHDTHTAGTDVWDFGLLVYQLTTLGELPHVADGDESIRQYIKIGETIPPPSNCSSRM